MSGSDRVLVVAAHPDDEVLGCGGTMAAHVRRGDDVSILILAEGATSRSNERDVDAHAAELERLRAAGRAAAAVLGVREVSFAGLPDNRMDAVPLLDVVKIVETHVARVHPTVVYTHAPGDLNVDHQITSRAVVTAVRPLPGSVVRALRFFEVPSSSEWGAPPVGEPFLPTHFVDVGDALAAKLDALHAYDAEMRPWPHARSYRAVEALARWRGASVGVEAAEAFVTVRAIGL